MGALEYIPIKHKENDNYKVNVEELLEVAKRILENWIIWIVVNIICVFLYFQKHILFVSFEYLIFLGLAVYGFWHWKQIHLKELSVQK